MAIIDVSGVRVQINVADTNLLETAVQDVGAMAGAVHPRAVHVGRRAIRVQVDQGTLRRRVLAEGPREVAFAEGGNLVT